MNRNFFIIAGLLFLLLSSVVPGHCEQGESRYVTVKYENNDILRTFDDRLEIGSSLRSMMRKNTVSLQDEVLAKVDIVVEKAETVLDMFPDDLHFTLVLLPSSSDVDAVFLQKYQKTVDYLSFYSLSEKTIYISVEDTNLHVLAHEIGHAIVDRYFKVRPPYNIHELMAQFTEKHITD